MSAPHLDDEMMSAVIDGEASAADLNHAETCEECASKVAAWRGAIALLKAAPAPAVSEARRDHAIEAALAELDAPAVADLAEHRRRRLAAFGPGRVAAAAAAVAAVAGLALGVTQLNGGGSPKASTASRAPAAKSAAPTTFPQILGGAASGTENGTSSGGVAAGPTVNAPTAASPLADLGKVASVDQIAPLLRAQVARTPHAPTQYASAQTTQGCQAAARRSAGAPATSAPVLEATVTYQGRTYLATVFPATAKGSYLYAVQAESGCRLLTTGSFS